MFKYTYFFLCQNINEMGLIMSYGNVKKIDELGRIVIPRNIRKSLSIKKDDSLEIGIVGENITISKAISIKQYNETVIKYAKMFSDCNISLLVTNRDKILFNNTEIINLDVASLINLSLFELMNKKAEICSECDIRPIIIDSNPEGIVIISKSSCNEIVGELFNKIVTTELDISC
jgi:bifunctional DNA-binding transcriptional regulator/antitoxin component of YhaV-PrlF toxin-antitoxin module